ncbi:response regulator [Anditalea andensis]|uniref:LuxR family transcriptional regulator n=1 Tax=Anditalea andensis TaxID=1048983 RepID=A0A074KUV4_9BACT|nr:response regulator transcription factor [Anditalea andensis]KEO73756.1 hypothetical protein EL17_09575 [Anditalea andensis]
MNLNTIHIAIVDDHELFSLGMKALIAGFIPPQHISVMHDGKELIKAIASGTPMDLVLLDLQMPDIDGKAVIRHLQNTGSVIKVIVISMHNDRYVIEECKEMGADGYIKKDSTTMILEEGITQVLEGKKYFPALSCKPDDSPVSDIIKTYGLTKREIEIIKMVKNNYSSHRIADILHISYQTVKTHRKNINQKLNITNVVALIEFAHKYKL